MISVLNIILVSITSIYCLGLLLFFIGLFFPNKERPGSDTFVSIVIAVKDEEENIAQLLSDLVHQSYPHDKFEVIVVNDRSEDGTVGIVQHFCEEQENFRLLLVSSEEKELTAKKNAMSHGIKHSRGEIILTTDGDCRVLPTWVEAMVTYFGSDVGMVVGFSQLGLAGEKRSLFQRLQAIDFLSLMAGAQGALNLRWPLAASGQNLAYRREVFEEVDGFSSIGHRVSGDDVLLLQLVHKKTHWKICFASSSDGYNVSSPEKTLNGFLNQRIRWGSNGAYQIRLNKIFFLYVLITFLVNLGLLVLFPVSLVLTRTVGILGLCFMMKCFAEGLVIIHGCRVYQRFDLLGFFPLWFLLQIPYVVLVGILGSVGSFHWKKRSHPLGGGRKH